MLKNFYLNKGYYDVLIESATVTFNNDQSFKLIYKINAGEIYNIKNTKLNLPIDYDKENFQDVIIELNDLKGERYSLRKITKVIEEIDKISLSRQYDFINANLEEKKYPDSSLDIIINVNESEKFYVERINIFGNNITHESVIRNELEIDEGDPFNKLLNAKSINNLRSTRLFKNVTSNLRNGSEYKNCRYYCRRAAYR